MNSINWGQLVARGAAKAHGIPWSPEEEKAIYVLKIPADFVRDGVLTLEAYKKAVKEDETEQKETGEKPINKMTRAELLAKAKELDIEVTPEVTVAALREVISAKTAEKDNE